MSIVEKDYKKILIDYIILTLGVLINAVGIVAFLIPNKIAAGGASGLAIVLNKFLPIPIGVLMYIINGVLLLLAFVIVGFDFSFKTIYCTFLMNFLIDLFDRIIVIPKYYAGDYFLAVFFGDILTAVGMALTFTRNGSTGGTDILAKIINKFLSTPMGLTILALDLVIGISAGFAYSSSIGMYSVMAIIVNGTTIDFVLKGLELSVVVWIVSDKYEDIRKFIINELERGVTMLDAIGGYTLNHHKLLYTVVKRRELNTLIRRIREIDRKSFISVSESTAVYGEGFKEYI